MQSEPFNPDFEEVRKRTNRLLERVKSFSKKNYLLILDFHQNHNLIQAGPNGQWRNIHTLVKLVTKHDFDLGKITEDDIKRLNAYWLETCAKGTRNREISTVKVFIRNLLSSSGLTQKERYRLEGLLKLKVLKKTDPYKDTGSKIQASDLLTQHEVMDLIKYSNLKYKAFWAMLYGSSCRVSAIRHLKKKAVIFEEDDSVTINIVSKGQINSIWIRSDFGLHLKKWLNYSPCPTEESYVFPNPHGAPLSYASVAKMLRLATQKAKITKRVFPHLFRHSSISELLNSGFNPLFLKKRAWGSESTTMLERVYGHLNQGAVNQAMKEFTGQVKHEPPKFDLAQKTCFSCGQPNAFNTQFCEKCGINLENPQDLSKKKELEAQLIAMKEQMKMMQETLVQLSSKPIEKTV